MSTTTTTRVAGRSRWWARRPASLHGRVVLTVLALLAVLLVGLFVAVDLALSARLRADLRTRLTDRVALAGQLDGSLAAQQLVDHLRGNGVTAQLCTSGAGCVTADPAPTPPADGQRPPLPKPAKHPKVPGATVRRAGGTLFVSVTLAAGQTLTLSVDDSAVSGALSRLVVLEALGGVTALAVAGLALGRLVGVALRPLDRMTAVARGIAAGDRGNRLRTGRPDTELGRTATAFDAMLEELESAAAAAEAAETRMRGFLSDASHELRTPLAGIQATAEQLLRADPDRPAREAALAGLVRESSRAGRLVQDLLTVARLDQGVPLRPEQLDLVQLSRHELARTQLLGPQLTVQLSGDPAVPVIADGTRVGQILTNLLDNARHATPPGGTITVTVRRTPVGAVLDVTDTGAGVPTVDRDRIFDRLVRLDTARSRSSGGAGLGLPIARALARAHGGDLQYLRDPAVPGARFRLTLPDPAVTVPVQHAHADAAGDSDTAARPVAATRARDRDEQTTRR